MKLSKKQNKQKALSKKIMKARRNKYSVDPNRNVCYLSSWEIYKLKKAGKAIPYQSQSNESLTLEKAWKRRLGV